MDFLSCFNQLIPLRTNPNTLRTTLIYVGLGVNSSWQNFDDSEFGQHASVFQMQWYH